jgi:hypothetical protein
MPNDVIQKVRTSEDTSNGGTYIYSNQNNPYDTIIPGEIISVDGVARKYTDRMTGLTIVYDDMQVPATDLSLPGIADPNLVNFTIDGVNYKGYEFAVNDEVHFLKQLSHKYYEGGNLIPHVHFSAADNAVTESGNYVVWQLDYTIANVRDAFTTSNSVVMSGQVDGTLNKHDLATAGGVLISGSGVQISAMIFGRLRRISDEWGGITTNNLPILLEFDAHYPIDADGSRQHFSK